MPHSPPLRQRNFIYAPELEVTPVLETNELPDTIAFSIIQYTSTTGTEDDVNTILLIRRLVAISKTIKAVFSLCVNAASPVRQVGSIICYRPEGW